jgi:hypothetical protein
MDDMDTMVIMDSMDKSSRGIVRNVSGKCKRSFMAATGLRHELSG